MIRKPFMTHIMKEKQNRQAIIRWCQTLEANRGARARLRRCREPVQVLLHASFYRLRALLPDWPWNQTLALAATAGLIANTDTAEITPSGMSFPAQLGSSKTESGSPVMSATRFRQLIKSRDWQEFYRRMRRAVRMLKTNANILSIADYVLQFGYEQRGTIPHEPSQGFQFRFAQDYFEAGLTKAQKEAS